MPEGLKQRATAMCSISSCLGMALLSIGPTRLLAIFTHADLCDLGGSDSIPCSIVVFCKHGTVAVGSRKACNMGKLY